MENLEIHQTTKELHKKEKKSYSGASDNPHLIKKRSKQEKE
jgi:hypothetical protein